MSEQFVDTLPDRQVDASVANDLEALDGIEQCVAVRGTYDGDQLAYQLLVNITGRGVLALHYDDEWRVVYDSVSDDPGVSDAELLYTHAHDALYDHAESNPESNHYETTPPYWSPPDDE